MTADDSHIPPGGGAPEDGWDAEPAEQLLARCLEAPRRERAARLEALCSENPEHAEELRRLYEELQAMGLAAVDADEPATDVPQELGDFRLLEAIGGGGMGVVYRAEQVSLGREVAIKLIRPDQLYFPRARDRFRREVEAIARLSHPGIVPVYTVGEDGGIPYFAMEWVRGATLAAVINALAVRAPESLTGRDMIEVVVRASGDVPDSLPKAFRGSWVDACLGVTRQVALALHHAHERGILHRDVKPSNVVLTPDGRAMLLDFGLTSSRRSDRVTRSGAQVGTPVYMSPQQIRGSQELDRRTDVYSLGVTLYELLTLAVPYRGTDSVETQNLILDGRPDSIRARNRRVPVDAQTICLQAMDADPTRRYRSTDAFARDLENVLARRPIEARPPGPAARARRWLQRNPRARWRPRVDVRARDRRPDGAAPAGPVAQRGAHGTGRRTSHCAGRGARSPAVGDPISRRGRPTARAGRGSASRVGAGSAIGPAAKRAIRERRSTT